VRPQALRPADHDELQALLLQDVESNLYLLGRLESGSLEQGEPWLGLRSATGQVCAGVYLGGWRAGHLAGNAVPFGPGPGFDRLGPSVAGMGGAWMIIGPRQPCDALWAGMGRPRYRMCFDQRLMVCEGSSDGPTLQCSSPARHELELGAAWAAAMLAEDLTLLPGALDRDLHRARYQERAQRGSALMAREDGQPCFVIDVGTSCAWGQQVGGTYVPPELRGRGVATRAMRGLVQSALREHPRVTLHVHETNLPAIRCYQAAGFRWAAPFRLLTL
jgi:uncharacterized protein